MFREIKSAGITGGFRRRRRLMYIPGKKTLAANEKVSEKNKGGTKDETYYRDNK